jgi:predicted hotdog family 3-hydroxylacyl-ACP dehydratase
MSDVPTSAAEIERLIPHRAPMRLVEEVVRVDGQAIETAAVVRDTWPTAEKGLARALVLIELLAQSAAVLQGWKERHEKETGEGGLLVGIHSAIPSQPTIAVGTRVFCRVRISHGATNYLAFEGEVRDAESVVWLTGAIQAFRPELGAQPGEST